MCGLSIYIWVPLNCSAVTNNIVNGEKVQMHGSPHPYSCMTNLLHALRAHHVDMLLHWNEVRVNIKKDCASVQPDNLLKGTKWLWEESLSLEGKTCLGNRNFVLKSFHPFKGVKIFLGVAPAPLTIGARGMVLNILTFPMVKNKPFYSCFCLLVSIHLCFYYFTHCDYGVSTWNEKNYLY